GDEAHRREHSGSEAGDAQERGPHRERGAAGEIQSGAAGFPIRKGSASSPRRRGSNLKLLNGVPAFAGTTSHSVAAGFIPCQRFSFELRTPKRSRIRPTVCATRSSSVFGSA